MAVTQQMLVIGENLLGAGNVAGSSIDLDRVGAHGDGYVQPIFEQSQVFVTGAKEGFDIRADLDLGLHLVSVSCLLGLGRFTCGWLEGSGGGSETSLHRTLSGSEKGCDPRCSPRRKTRTLLASVPRFPNRVNRRKSRNRVLLGALLVLLYKLNPTKIRWRQGAKGGVVCRMSLRPVK